ncbi:MAG: DUF1015 domain-containing protein [Desulfovibrionaceae bacterium]|nr:DUF1015 domain-containing protein [Desulfovibrionaceae bacterium]
MPEFIPLAFAHFDFSRADLAADKTASPPYDVLSSAQRDALAAKSGHNMTHIDLPPTYEDAAATLANWVREKAVVHDGAAAYYLLATSYDLDERRLTRYTVFGGLRLAPWGEAGVYPHEKTYPKAKTDRLNLMRATKAQLSPILGVFDRPGLDLAALGARAMSEPPLAQFTEDAASAEAGALVHRLWKLPREAEKILGDALAGLDVYIADGHHRYETALAYRGERGPGTPDSPKPWDFVFAGLCNIASEGVVILPYHRQLTFAQTFDFPEALRRAETLFEVKAGATRADLGATQNEAACLLRAASGDWLLTPRASALKLSPAEQPFARIGAYVFDHLFCESVLGLTAADLAAGNHLKHTPFARQAAQAVKSGQAQAAAILKPVHIDVLREVSHAGLTMPRKSTYFYPKLPTGLLLHLFE